LQPVTPETSADSIAQGNFFLVVALAVQPDIDTDRKYDGGSGKEPQKQ
jgi:hypothetical protein